MKARGGLSWGGGDNGDKSGVHAAVELFEKAASMPWNFLIEWAQAMEKRTT